MLDTESSGIRPCITPTQQEEVNRAENTGGSADLRDRINSIKGFENCMYFFVNCFLEYWVRCNGKRPPMEVTGSNLIRLGEQSRLGSWCAGCEQG
eukprot:m.104007 g.104007  ORF g.104007 m.104007 type:complete len:95 (-) comp51580_c0_seq2:847-1131(-)